MSAKKFIPDLVQLPMFEPITIKVGKNYTAIVDPIDADLAMCSWHPAGQAKRNNVYAARAVGKKYVRMHVEIMERVLGRKMFPKEEVDHIDGNHFNNRRSNLRPATRSQNMRNQKKRSDNTSGLKGVSWHQHAWMAQIQIEGKKIYLGLYNTPEEAHQAYRDAAKNLHGEYARTD